MRLSVTTKIFLGLAVIVVTFGLVSIYAVVQVHHIGRSLELTSRTYLPLTKLASQLETVQSHRSRDTGRLLEEREGRVQTLLISIARRHFPKVVRDKLELGTEIARAGRERALDAADAEFLVEVEAWLEQLGTLYDDYDAAAEAVYRRIESGGALAEAGPDGARLADDLRRLERRLEREIKDLGRALDDKVTEQVRRTEAEESRVTFTILVLSLTAVLVAFAVILFAQRTLRPIRRLTEGVQDVRRGDFERRVEAVGHDEIADLAREFNAMARALSERESELAGQRTALLRAERLAAVGQMAAQVSHEVRNPLSSIGLNAELMADELAAARFDDPARAAEARALLQAIAAEVDRLTEITEEYLRFARMPRPSLAPEDANAVVRDVVAFVAEEMRTAGVRVVTDLSPDLPLALADEGQLRQALLNLLRNAREALVGRDDGTVRVVTRENRGRIHVEVSDDGPGIAPEDRERIFDPFVSTKEGGTGLGLPLIQQIVAEHGGMVSCESETGRGTTFRLDLRAAQDRGSHASDDEDAPSAEPTEATGDTAEALGSAGEGVG